MSTLNLKSIIASSSTAFIIGLVGTIFGIYSYFDTKPERRISYDIQIVRISNIDYLTNRNKDSIVKINGIKIENETQYGIRIRIKNSGNQEIDPIHIVRNIVLNIRIDGNVLLKSLFSSDDFEKNVILKHENGEISVQPINKWYPGDHLDFFFAAKNIKLEDIVTGAVRNIKGIEEINSSTISKMFLVLYPMQQEYRMIMSYILTTFLYSFGFIFIVRLSIIYNKKERGILSTNTYKIAKYLAIFSFCVLLVFIIPNILFIWNGNRILEW